MIGNLIGTTCKYFSCECVISIFCGCLVAPRLCWIFPDVTVCRAFFGLFDWHLTVIFLITSHFWLHIPFLLRFCPSNNQNIFSLILVFWPGTLGFFRIVVGVLLKFACLVCRKIICVCCDMTWFHVWISVQLVVSVCTPFWISKLCFWINMYPELNPTFSILSKKLDVTAC